MKQIFHHYELWEDYQNGMYRRAWEEKGANAIEKCKGLLSDPAKLYSHMDYVVCHWWHAAEVNLSNRNRNRQAWLGQAACCHAFGAPEYVTKLAWHELTDEQCIAANKVADRVIKEWEGRHGAGS